MYGPLFQDICILQYISAEMKTDKFVLILLFRLFYMGSLCGNLYLIYFAAAHSSLSAFERVCIILFAISNLWFTAMNYKLSQKKATENGTLNFQE
jgi:lipid-A-disaccharide synthase-like uncharacterized protein